MRNENEGKIDLKRLQNSLFTKPGGDPLRFFSLIKGYYDSAQILCAITGASRMGIFDYLTTPRTMEEIAGFYSHPAMIPPLIQVLEQAGLVQGTPDGFQCSELAKTFFSIHSPYNQIPYLEKLLLHLKDLWLNLPEILLTGPKLYEEQEFFAERSLPSMAVNALTGRLQDVTNAVTGLPRFQASRSLIDLGGGHGLYACALAVQNPALHAVVFDLPQVIPLTRTYIAQYGMESQVSTIGGDFFVDDIGTGYDVILSSSNPSGKATGMLSKIVSSLNDGGYFVNIQPGDSPSEEDPVTLLEWELWSFTDAEIQKTGWGKKKGFLTPEYLKALEDAGLDIISFTNIPDPYIKNFVVTMLIAEKPLKDK